MKESIFLHWQAARNFTQEAIHGMESRKKRNPELERKDALLLVEALLAIRTKCGPHTDGHQTCLGCCFKNGCNCGKKFLLDWRKDLQKQGGRDE
ncbi:MAG: hypothetical protein LBO80_12040 [Treponema sp.]|jgi:hypothetical protein|nr:hypothetical protein [Treponema sp.]